MKRRCSQTGQISRRWRIVIGPLAALLVAALAACGSVSEMPQDDVPLAAGKASPAFVQTMDVVVGETIADVEERTGGEVLVWEPGEYAIVGLGESGETTGDASIIEENSESFLAGGKMAEMNGASLIWSGGASLIWSGGASLIWSGGASLIWSGGDFLWMPENSSAWQQINLDKGHQLASNLGAGITVAVIDTGIDLEHPGLREALASSEDWYDFYDDDRQPQEEGSYDDPGYGHGTVVAGIVRQVAPRATILPIRVLGPSGQGDVADLSAAIHWAVERGADVINLSLGAEHRIQAVDKALRAAAQQGVFVLTSTGNTADRQVTYPATATYNGTEAAVMLSVASVSASDEKSDFSTYHRQIELSAPGEAIFGPAPEERQAGWSGTSMASPIAAGTIALALGESLSVDISRLGEYLKETSADIYADGLNSEFENEVGEGRIDVAAFLAATVQSEGSEID